MKEAIHYGNIGVVVTVIVLAVDIVLFGRSSELAYQAGGLFAMFAGVAVGLFLMERARRHADRNQ
ncbi:MAG TPA: hypothetical protein VG816_02140 [Solirubrobacterales bacterium]|nr:hypothetical protein [Solirubrobacterales bacterium]